MCANLASCSGVYCIRPLICNPLKGGGQLWPPAAGLIHRRRPPGGAVSDHECLVQYGIRPQPSKAHGKWSFVAPTACGNRCRTGCGLWHHYVSPDAQQPYIAMNVHQMCYVTKRSHVYRRSRSMAFHIDTQYTVTTLCTFYVGSGVLGSQNIRVPFLFFI